MSDPFSIVNATIAVQLSQDTLFVQFCTSTLIFSAQFAAQSCEENSLLLHISLLLFAVFCFSLLLLSLSLSLSLCAADFSRFQMLTLL